MEGYGGSDILKLAELLRPPNEDFEFEDDQRVRKTSAKASPADFAKPKIVKAEKEEEKIDDDYEKELLKETGDTDWRKCPQWDLIYKQSVTPSDVFLQISGKTQLTSSCEDMVITVELPGEKASGIDVKLTKDHLDLVSQQFRLSIPLPHQVDPQQGNAKWDSTNEKLILTLKMDREFDYVNF